MTKNTILDFLGLYGTVATGEAFMFYSKELKTNLVKLNASPMWNGPNIAAEYFAFSGDLLRLVRIENDSERLVQNIYTYSNATIGPTIDAEMDYKWINMLESKNSVDRLAALTYLGGFHKGALTMERVQKLRQNPKVQKLTKQYTKSKNKWIQEAAKMLEEQTINMD